MSLLDELLNYSEQLNDVVLGELEYSPVEIASTVSTTTDQVKSKETVSRPDNPYKTLSLTGLTVDRDDKIYYIGTHEDLDYARILYIQNIPDTLRVKRSLETDESLSHGEAVSILSERHSKCATQSLKTELTQLLSDSSCEYYIETTDSGCVTYIEVSKKIFPQTTIAEFDTTVQEVINTGLRATKELELSYELPEINPQYPQ